MRSHKCPPKTDRAQPRKTELATQDTPYDTHSDDTENQAYEDDYAADASLQSVTAETLSPDKPLENIASAAIPAQRIPLCLPLATRKTSIQTPQVQTPLTTATQQKQERFLNLPGCSPCSRQPLNRPQKINHTRTLFPLPIPEKKMPLWLPLIPVKKMPLPPPLTTRARRQKNIPGVKAAHRHLPLRRGRDPAHHHNAV